jgi:ferredoxin
VSDERLQVQIDRETCVRSRQCTFAHPRVFRIGADGFPEPVADALSPELEAEAREAGDVCPSGSITVAPAGRGGSR